MLIKIVRHLRCEMCTDNLLTYLTNWIRAQCCNVCTFHDNCCWYNKNSFPFFELWGINVPALERLLQFVKWVVCYTITVKTLQDASISTDDLISPQVLHLDPELKHRECFPERNHLSDYNYKKYDQGWSTEGDIIDYVCVGSTFIILLILLCVLVFYVIKDHHESE